MKLLIFSDIHGDRQALEKLMDTEADYYFAAGDLVSWAKGFDRVGDILKRRADRVHVLPGNHESENDIAGFCKRYGFKPFHGQTMQIEEYQVAGLGYSNPTPFNTPGEYSEEELAARLEKFANLRPLILICHAPPKGTPLDRVRKGIHAGSQAVYNFIVQHQPAYFFCGHIHEAEGQTAQFGVTLGANVGRRGYLLDFDKIEKRHVD